MENVGSGNLLRWRPPLLAELWGITAYRIYRTNDPAAPPSAYQLLDQVPPVVNEYFDGQGGPAHNYMITAVGDCGEGLPAFAPFQPPYPRCPPLQPVWDPTWPGGINPNPRPECILPPTVAP